MLANILFFLKKKVRIRKTSKTVQNRECDFPDGAQISKLMNGYHIILFNQSFDS